MIHKSATKAATIEFTNGNSVTLWPGRNRNTGESIVWQVVRRDGKLGRSTQVTGRNIAKLGKEITDVIAKGEGRYSYSNAASLTWILYA